MASPRPSPRSKPGKATPSGRIRAWWSKAGGWMVLPNMRRLAVLGSLVAITVATLVLFLDMKRGGLNRFGLQALANGAATSAPAKPSGYIRR